MRYPIIKNTLWFFLLTTFLLATFQPLLLEVAHRVAHLGDQTHHHSFHEHTVDHTHTQLTQFADASSNDRKDASPIATVEFNFKLLIAITPIILLPTHVTEYTSTLFIPSSALPSSIYLGCETPPPDLFRAV